MRKVYYVNDDEAQVESKRVLNIAKKRPYYKNDSKNLLGNLHRLLTLALIVFAYYQWEAFQELRSGFYQEMISNIKKNGSIEEHNQKVTSILQFLLSDKKTGSNDIPIPVPVMQKKEPVIGLTNGKKANLRTAPRPDSDILMVLTGKNEVIIEGENGNYYEVLSPTGEKAYVAKSLVDIPTDIG